MGNLEHYVKKILASRVYDVAVETPLQEAPNISARLGHRVTLKREDLQPVFSFKLRGSYNKMAQLRPADRARGVIAASAGNHAQGVALSAGRLGIKAHIVMGRNTPSIKVDAVRNLGARIVLHGDTYQHAAEHAARLADRRGYVWVHPYDDVDVIAGQGTVGMEIMNQHPGPDAIFVPVGGGGLIAGIAAYVKYLRPRTRIIGVEAEGSACLAAALEAGSRVRLPYDPLDLFADGVSVAQVGREPFKIARSCVDSVVTVSIDEICAAIKDVFDDT
ncbi:MAG: pyridoxal-phosphate dependent enzyme, partial [Gammaproteobacteria bacterium]|nr:pyridoxal-phosphate dependent enzyme [Gammaproteobacteria bacterium]